MHHKNSVRDNSNRYLGLPDCYYPEGGRDAYRRMPAVTRILTVVRIGLVIVGAGVTALTVGYLASMPPPPPNSDGFAHGMAAIFGGGIILLSLGLATITIILPTLLGRDDPLGFSRWQRLALKGAGGLIGLGLLLALVGGLSGVFHLLALVVVAFGVVCAMLVWRGLEIVLDRWTRTNGVD